MHNYMFEFKKNVTDKYHPSLSSLFRAPDTGILKPVLDKTNSPDKGFFF